MATKMGYEDPVDHARRRGVREPNHCRCAGCPWHYDVDTPCDCEGNPEIGSLCRKHARAAGLRIGPSSIVGRGVFAQRKTGPIRKSRERSVVFRKGTIIGYYGGVYRDERESEDDRNYYGPEYDVYMMAVTEYEDMRFVTPPQKALKLHDGSAQSRLHRWNKDYEPKEEGERKSQIWDIDARDGTCSMLKYANDPIGTEHEANAYFDDAYFKLDKTQHQRFLEGKHFYFGDAKILFTGEARRVFLSTRGAYASNDYKNSPLNRFAVPGCVIVAERDIYDGEEILISYGESGYWSKIETDTDGDEDEVFVESEDDEEEENDREGPPRKVCFEDSGLCTSDDEGTLWNAVNDDDQNEEDEGMDSE